MEEESRVVILVAPTAFKGTIGAAAAARAMAAGARRASGRRPVRTLPLSDGGLGLLDALEAAWGGTRERVRVTGPLGEPVEASLLSSPEGSVVESAEACGLHLVPPDRRDPLRSGTYGVGELIARAASGRGDEGAERPARIILGLGGSATVDGGAGMAAALGWRLLDMDGRAIGGGAQGLLDLSRISRPERGLDLPPVTALADVANPLLGENGAAAVYGPQKGASASTVRRLELALARLATRVEEDLGRSVRTLPGAGAAGGLGAGAVAFLDAELVRGAGWVLGAVGFAEALAGSELVITGEGAFDAQSAMGKVTGEVLDRARARGAPVLLVAGSIEVAPAEGVTSVDGGGETLTPERIEALVEREVARLLG
ncbi:MAG: glycerate kinase [Gemmatimonadota bacterium]